MILATAIAVLLDYRPAHADSTAGLAFLLGNLWVFGLLCLVLGYWWAGKRKHWLTRAAFALLFSAAIALVNGMISAAGCALGSLI
jgi:hypothetical protein